MSPTRRDFVKLLSAGALGAYSHEIVAELIALGPKGQVRESKFKGLADLALGEAKTGGCSYADIRFTMTTGLTGGMASFTTAGTGRGAAGGGGGGGGRGGGGGGGGGGRGGGRGGTIPSAADRQAAGFGVRVS